LNRFRSAGCLPGQQVTGGQPYNARVDLPFAQGSGDRNPVVTVLDEVDIPNLDKIHWGKPPAGKPGGRYPEPPIAIVASQRAKIAIEVLGPARACCAHDIYQGHIRCTDGFPAHYIDLLQDICQVVKSRPPFASYQSLDGRNQVARGCLLKQVTGDSLETYCPHHLSCLWDISVIIHDVSPENTSAKSASTVGQTVSLTRKLTVCATFLSRK
jgi:hypothetical protein